VNDSLKYGLSVHFLTDVFFFLNFFPFKYRLILTNGSDKPPKSIFFRFLHSKMQTVSLPDVGTYRKEKQTSPRASCEKNEKNH